MSLPETNEIITAMTSVGGQFQSSQKSKTYAPFRAIMPKPLQLPLLQYTMGQVIRAKPRTGDPGTLQENQTLQLQRST